MTKELKYPGLRLLVSGAMLDREWFKKDFTELLKEVLAWGIEKNADLELDDAQIEAARAAHASRDMHQVFDLAYWPLYDALREDGTIPQIAAFWEM